MLEKRQKEQENQRRKWAYGCDLCGRPWGFVNTPVTIKIGTLAGKWIGIECCARTVFEEKSWKLKPEYESNYPKQSKLI